MSEMKATICFHCKIPTFEERILKDVQLTIKDITNLECKVEKSQLLIEECIRTDVGQDTEVNGEIVCIHWEKCGSFLTEKKNKESSTTVMVQVDLPKKHFITLHFNFSEKKVIFMDSFQCIDNLKLYPELESILKPIMIGLEISTIPVSIQKEIDGGFFHAFLNSLTVEWSKYMTINKTFEIFLKEVDNFQGILKTNRKGLIDQHIYRRNDWKTVAKERIKSGYEKGETLDEIKSIKNTEYPNLPRESVVYFELQYAKQVAYNFLSNLEEILKKDSGFCVHRSIVHHILEIKDIKEPFNTVKNYEQLQKHAEFLDFKSKSRFLKCFQNLCLCNSTPVKNIDIIAKKCSNDLLKNINDLASLMPSQLQKGLQYAKENSNTEKFSLYISNDNSLISLGNFSTIFITENGIDIIRCDGIKFDLDTVNTEIIAKHELFDKCSQIEIQAKLCFCVNCSVKWPGKNVIILTDTLIVDDIHKNFSIDVSGKDGLSHEKKNAKNGNKNRDGLAGEPGFHGKSGGNFQIIADVYTNEANMSVISNGGNGSCGQDGGKGADGIDGVDGEEITEDEFNYRFPDVAYASASVYGGNFRAFVENNTFTFQSKVIETGDFATGGRRIENGVVINKRGVGGGEYHCKGVTDDKYEVEYGCYSGYITRESYCICFGQLGTPGKRGGNGGKGGAAGKGGFEGKSDIRNWKGKPIQTITTTCRSGYPGVDGEDGKGGKGGRNGYSGNDRAHVCPATWRETRKYMGYLQIVTSETSNSEMAYCPKRKKYVGVNTIASAYPTLQRCEDGKKGHNTKRIKNRMNEEPRTKNPPITFETLIKERFQLFFNEKDNNTHHFEETIKTTSAIEEDFIAKYTSSHQKKVIKESKQRKENCMQYNQLLPISDTRYLSHFHFTPMFSFEEGCYLNIFLMEKYETVLKAVKEGSKHPFPEKTLCTIFAIFGQISIENSFNEKHYECFLELLYLIKKKCMKPNCTTNRTNLDINYWYDSIMINFKFWLLSEANEMTKHYIKEKENEMDIDDPFSKTVLDDLRIGLKIFFENLILDVLKSDDVAHLNTTTQSLQTTLTDLMQEIKEFRRTVSLYGENVPMSVAKVMKGLSEKTKEESDSKSEMEIENKIVSSEEIEPMFNDAEFVYETYDDGNCVSPDINALLEWALSKTRNKADMCCIIKKLRYINSDHASVIIKCLKYRLINQCCQVSEEFLFWFLVRLLENEEGIQNRKYLILLATTKPENWIFEWIIQETVCHSDFPNEFTFRDLLSKIDKNIHLFLCRYLSKLKDGEIMTTHTIEVMMRTLQTLNPDVKENVLMILGETNVFEWKYRIKWLENIKALESFSWTDQSTLLDAAYYSSQIINRKGQKWIDEIYCFVRKYEVNEGMFLSSLKRIFAGSLSIDIQELKSIKSSKEAYTLFGYNYNNHDRNTSENILSLMKVDNNFSLPEDKLSKIRILLNEINDMGSKPSQLLANSAKKDTKRNDYTTKQISFFTEHDINHWSQVCMQELKSHAEQFNNLFTELVAIIEKAIHLKKRFILRNTQKISIIAFLFDTDWSDKGLLQQMSTGEGKTMVIVALSILKGLKGEKVDIITSSSVLAKRDSDINKDIYELFMISVSNNCSQNKHDRQEAYSSLVVYGEIGIFQRDLLLTEFYDENIIGGRHRKNVIVDEVDSMLLDRGETVLYLSHEIAGIDAIEFVYIYIWSLVNIKGVTGTDEDCRNVRRCMLDAMYGVISMEDIRKCSPLTNNMDVHKIWKILQNEHIINHEGRLLTRSYKRFEEFQNKGTGYSCSTTGYITNMLKDTVRKGILVEFPIFLDSYINRHLDIWIRNAFHAKYMEEGKHFIIDIERTENGRGKDANIIVMDIDTGTEQYHTQWNSGLHQFLQLKYKCAISANSLKAVFMSNISFFRLYENLYGLTGTLGSQKERNLLKDMYNVSYITIPTFQEPRFVEEETVLCESTNTWMKSITETAVSLSKSRPILIICETIHSCNEIEKEFKHNGTFVYVYKNSYCELSILKNKMELDAGCIILATNLAGRGTDIQISENISVRGGLHVILTYLPSNLRIEEQAFGRAARKGQRGSGQLIICECFEGQNTVTEKFSIARMKIQRDTTENERISKIQQRYETFIQSEEKLFKIFQNFYDKLKLKLISGNTNAEFQKVILQALVDRWAFWLDSVESSLETSEKFSSITDNLTVFLEEVDVSNDPGDNSKMIKMLGSPSQLVKAGKAKASTKDFFQAHAFFDSVIYNDKSFCESAIYYKVHCLLKTGDCTADDYKVVRNYLGYCKCLIQQRIEKLRNSVQVVNVFSSQFTIERESLTLSEGFVQQKENVIQIYNQIIDSIDSITGYEIEPHMFVNATCSHFNAHMIFSDLEKVKILSPHKVRIFPPEKTSWQSVKKIYELYSTDIYLQLKNIKDQDRVTAVDLQNILPSREELWELLIHYGVLKDRQDYILVHEEKLQMCCDALPHHVTNILTSLKSNILLDDIHKYIFLYPDQKDKIIIREARLIPKRLFNDNLGFGKIFELLQKEKTVSHCSLATVASNGKAKLSTKLDKIDNLEQNSFVVIGVSDSASKEIFDQLVIDEIISRDGKLLTNEIGSIWLSSFSMYTTEIRNIVAKYSKYRICTYHLLEEHEFPIDLFLHPHENLFSDLIEVGIITPFKVKANMSEDDMTKQLKFLYSYECGKKNTAIIKILHVKEDNLSRGSHGIEQQITLLNKQINKSGEIDIGVFFSAYPEIHISEIDDLCRGSSFTGNAKELIDKMVCVKDESSESWYLTIVIKNTELKTISINQEESTCENEINCVISSRIQNYQNTSDIVAQLEGWREGLAKFENCDTELRSLGGSFSEKQLIGLCDEILSIAYNGFGELIVLQERKWTFKSVCKMNCILAIGLIQIGIAIAIEFYSIGTGTFVANAFLSEGIGDIVFAVECMISGHCTMQSYIEHKKLSLPMTAASAGIGAFAARGSQFSRFGHKIGGQFLQHQSGKTLLKKGVSDRLLAKAAAKWIGKKLVEVTSIKLVDKGVDFAIEKAIRTSLVSLCSQISDIGPTVDSEIVTALQKSLSYLAKKMDNRNAEELIKQLMEKCSIFHKSDISMVLCTVGKIANTFCDGLGVAIEKMEYIGNTRVKCFKKITKIVSAIAKGINVINAVQEVAKMRLLILEKFITRVDAKSQILEKHIEVHDCEAWISKNVDYIIKKSNTEVSKYIEKQLEEILVKPLLQTVGYKVTKQMSKRVRTLYRFGKKCLHYSDFKILKEEFQPILKQSSSGIKDEMQIQYNRKLINLLMKTRSAELFAEIVEEGIPLGIHCVQAVAEISQVVINIETIGGDEVTMPQKFTPCGVGDRNLKSITLQFHLNRDTCIGHFLSQNDKKSGETNQYDCLLTAVMQETGIHLERKYIAEVIRKQSSIRNNIEQGIHEHYITKGGIGGVLRTEKKPLTSEIILSRCRKITKFQAALAANKNKYKELKDLKLLESDYLKKKSHVDTERLEIQKKIKKARKSDKAFYRDRAKISNNFVKATGNDELYEVHLVEMYAKRSIKDTPEYVKPTRIHFANQSEDVDYIKLFSYIRVDNCYVLHTKQDKLQGHPGALFNSKKNAESNSGGLTSGSKDVHTERTNVAMNYKENHLLSLLYVLKKHIEKLPTKARIEELDIKNCYSSTGLNLENEVDKAKFIKGFEREKYKLCLAAEFLIKQNKKCIRESKEEHIGESNEKNIGESKTKHITESKEKHVEEPKEKHVEEPKEKHIEESKDIPVEVPMETHIEESKDIPVEEPMEKHIEESKDIPVEEPMETHIEESKEKHNEETKEKQIEESNEKHITKSNEEHLEYLEKAFSELKPKINLEDEYIKRIRDELNKVENLKAFGNILQKPAPIN